MRCKSCGRFMTSNAPYNTPRGSTDEWFCTNPECRNYEYMLCLSKSLAEVGRKSGVSFDELASALTMKTCPKCGKTKHLKDFYKYESSGNTHTYWCKECIEHYIANTSVGAN